MATADDGAGRGDTRAPDPWQAVSYMLSGLIAYGLAGYGLDVWLGTDFLVGVGIVLGTGLGVLMIWFRWGKVPTETGTTQAGRSRAGADNDG